MIIKKLNSWISNVISNVITCNKVVFNKQVANWNKIINNNKKMNNNRNK